MELMILIPAVACWVVLARSSARHALVDVYLPAILLLPQYYSLRFPHLPPLRFADTAILPLGVAMLAKYMRRWRLAWMDLWVLLFAVSAALSEGLSTELANGQWVRLFTDPSEKMQASLLDNGVFQLFAGITTIVLPYMAGKLLIEHGEVNGQPVRKVLLRRMVAMLAMVAVICVFDFVAGRSSWQTVWRHFFPGQPMLWPMQMRWGFGRIAGPFAHAILAGMMFLMGLVYFFWLRRFAPGWGVRRLVEGLPLTVRGGMLAAIAAGLLMTQSRGPWLGMALSLLLIFLMQRFSVVKAAAIFVALTAVLSAAGYYYGKQYTNLEPSQSSKEEQQSAIYRRDLLRNYRPIVMARKAFGWGITTYPTMAGQQSIDNEYLMLAVTQGFTGLGLFLAIVAGSAGRLLWLAARPMAAEDKGLVIAHLAVLIGLMTAVATVYLGEQALLLFFLIVGWVQGMNPARAGVGVGGGLVEQFKFRRVLS
jgi:hypothetical protein